MTLEVVEGRICVGGDKQMTLEGERGWWGRDKLFELGFSADAVFNSRTRHSCMNRHDSIDHSFSTQL
jgi:hypothetical protein